MENERVTMMIEMTVEGIGIDPHNNPLVLLRDAERKMFVPIWIGPAEAISIQWELDHRQPPRPMTHDLMTNILREMGIRLLRVTVNDFSDQVYYARLHLQIGEDDTIQEVDARPSDAIALALRANCQILVSDDVAQKTGIQVEENEDVTDDDVANTPPEELSKFQRLLEGVDLGDGESN
jgi:bifunctional DNase/RNase